MQINEATGDTTNLGIQDNPIEGPCMKELAKGLERMFLSPAAAAPAISSAFTPSSQSIVLNPEETKAGRHPAEGPVSLSWFEILDMIGAGSFGKIYKVRFLPSAQIYAMKMFSIADMLKFNRLKYAVKECNVLKGLSHPFAIQLHYAFQTSKALFLVLDYCDGGDLGELIAARGILTEGQARFYTAELVLAVEYLHEHNIIYRDMKTDNILLCTPLH